ncbi:MAG: molybdopterin molybdotransferase MoeA, partial [Planctomycetota bacterium]
MIEYEKALELVLEHARPRDAERVPLAAARGRVLARDITARVASPPFDKAAMDGYAVRAEDVCELPAELEVAGEVFAGQRPAFAVGPGQAAVITTGAPVPPGADTVVMVEHTERAEGRVLVKRLSGSNICPAGEDVRVGQTVLRGGEALTPMRVGVAAMAGHADLPVIGRPSGALLCTGSEVVKPGQPVPEGKIYNSNGPMLSALMEEACGAFTYLGACGDEREELAAAVRQGLESDVLLISGGVSMGQYDLVPDVVEACGVRRVFHGVAIKPGKPVFFGATERGVVLGMPGNPQSCFVVFHMLGAPALAAMSGASELPPRLWQGLSAEGFACKPARLNVVPCMVEQAEGRNLLRRRPYHGSADI